MELSGSGPALERLLDPPGRALIVGVHTGLEAQEFVDAGHEVTGVDLLPPYRNGYKHIQSAFESTQFERNELFDTAYTSHTLEHVMDVGRFLRRLRSSLKLGGRLGLVVPGYPQSVFFVGHLTLWTPALLLYTLVVHGWNCIEAEFYTTPDRRHIGVVVPNQPISGSSLGWDGWEAAKKYLPVPFTHEMDAWLPDHWRFGQ